MSLITFFTPSICAASLAAASRAASLATVPVSVTVPLSALIESCLSGTLASPLILFCTSDATCASERLPTREHPATSIIRETRATKRLLFFIKMLLCHLWRLQVLDAELPESTASDSKFLLINNLDPFAVRKPHLAPAGAEGALIYFNPGWSGQLLKSGLSYKWANT